MKLRKPDGQIVEASIHKGNNDTISVMYEEGTGKKTIEAAVEKAAAGKFDLKDCELIEATDSERSLLKSAGWNMKEL